ncbi:MAG: hypothetical protein ACYDBQ_11275 [Thermoplasmatota archaeon]
MADIVRIGTAALVLFIFGVCAAAIVVPGALKTRPATAATTPPAHPVPKPPPPQAALVPPSHAPKPHRDDGDDGGPG